MIVMHKPVIKKHNFTSADFGQTHAQRDTRF